MKLILMLLLGISFSANAAFFSIDLNCSGSGYSNALEEAACDDLQDEMDDYANENNPDVELDEYTTGMSNALVMASRGNGTDYANNFDIFVVGGNFGLGYAGDQDEPAGIGFQGGLLAGLNLDILPVDKLGFIEFEKMSIFFNFFSYDLDQEADDTSTEGEISSFGVHVRYQIIDGVDFVPGGLVSWKGVHVHTGYQMSTNEISITTEIADEEFTQEVPGGDDLEASLEDTSATFAIESTTHTIPIEVSTAIQLLYVTSFYGGLGVDISSGGTEVSLEAEGDITGLPEDGEMDVDESEESSPNATNFRAFAGFQFNVPFVKIYAQMNKALSEDILGVQFGIKLLY